MRGRTTGAVALTIALAAAAFCAQAQPTVNFVFSLGNERSPDEGAAVNIPFSVSPAAPQAFTLHYRVDYDNAEANDHEPLSGSVSVAQGARTGQIRVVITDDEDIESPVETFTLRLLDRDEYNLGSGMAITAITVNIQEGVCDRSPDIVEGYQRATGRRCSHITNEDLAARTMFSRSNSPLARFKEKDFEGLINLERLSMHNKQLTLLWPRQFDGLASLTELALRNNRLTELPGAVFNGLTNLESLELHQNQIAELPQNVFQGLGNLARLHLHQNRLTKLPDNVFRNLTSLSELNLHQNQIAELPQNVFQGLTGLQTLRLDQNPLAGLQEDGFRDLGSLEVLRLDQTRLTGILFSTYFTGLTNLRELRLDQNDLQMRGGGAGSLFSGLTNLRELRLDDNQIAELPRIFARGNGNLNSLYLNQNRLTTLPEGIFANIPNLERLHLRDNPGAPFRFPLFLRPREPNKDLSEALLASEPVGVKLSLPMGAPYPLTVGLDVSGVTASAESVTIPAGNFDSESFMITRGSGANPFEIGFGELPAHPDNFDGFEIVGVPTVYDPNGTGPQVSRIRFISAPQNPGFYRPQLEETVHVDVIFDRSLVVTTAQTGASPTLALQIGDNQRAADYVPPRNNDDTLLSFSYTLTAQDDADEDGISIVAGGLQFNDLTVTGLFGRPASNVLAAPLLAARPEHKVRWTTSLSFAAYLDGQIQRAEGQTVDAAFNLDFPLQEPLVVRYTITDDTADRDDYTAGSGEITMPAGETAGNIRISITDDDDVELSRERFYLEFVDSADVTLGTSRRLAITINEGVCDRTPQVRDRLMDESDSSDCTDLDGDDLNKVTTLELNATNITSLKPRDFLGLVNLETLNLQENALRSLPEGVFDGLGKVSKLRLRDNRLTSLPAGVFAGINRNVNAANPQDNLWLFLEGNQLSSLPSGVFSGTDGLNWVNLANNQFAGDLPAGLFAGVSHSLRVLDLRSNSGTPFSLRLGIKLAGKPEPTAQAPESIDVPLRAILREGAPYRVNFLIHSPAAGDIRPSQEAIPVGGTESGVFILTQAADLEQNTVSLTDISPSSPPNYCPSWQRVESDECFNGLEVTAGAAFVLDSNSLSPGTALKIRVFLEGALE